MTKNSALNFPIPKHWTLPKKMGDSAIWFLRWQFRAACPVKIWYQDKCFQLKRRWRSIFFSWNFFLTQNPNLTSSFTFTSLPFNQTSIKPKPCNPQVLSDRSKIAIKIAGFSELTPPYLLSASFHRFSVWKTLKL